MATIYEVEEDDDERPVRTVALSIPKAELGKLNAKLDLLAKHGEQLPPGLLSSSKIPTIKKLRINGTTAWRIYVCRGPLRMDGTEFTLLHAVQEKDRKVPADSEAKAERRRLAILGGTLRRVRQERYVR